MLDLRLNEQVREPEYLSKKGALVNEEADLRGKLEAVERNRQNRFEPAMQFVLEAKMATYLLADGNSEKERHFLKKIGLTLQLADKSLAVELRKLGIYWPISILTRRLLPRSSAKFRPNQTGGRGGIRTPGELSSTSDFESGAFNHSATLPAVDYQ